MSERGATILLIEDEAPMRRFLRVSFASNHFRLIEAETGQDGLDLAVTRNPDLVLLDLGLPDVDGLIVTERLRQWASIPIIVISARGGEEDQIRAFEAGADDYVTKPFRIGELLARVRGALRRITRASNGSTRFSTADWSVDFAQRLVVVRGKEVHLTPIEYKLLVTLIGHAGRVMPHPQLLREVWGPRSSDQTQYLRVYMAQLRQKLERDPSRPVHLLTVPGIGYRLRGEG